MSSPPQPQKRGTKALELWCRRITEGYPNVKIENMTTSWRDGLAFCAMIHHFRPDLIEFEKLNKADIFKNNDLAFRTAEKYLGIPALLEAGDMMSYEVPDRLSILTYLSQFYRTFGNQESPASPERQMFKFKSTSPPTVGNSDIRDSPTNTPRFTDSPPASYLRTLSPSPSTTPPKREPCSKCGLPVFLAERIFFKNQLFHNSCFKCTRCDAQLIPGSLPSNQIDNLSCQACLDKEMGMLLFDDESDERDDVENDGSNENYDDDDNDVVVTTSKSNDYSYETKFSHDKERDNGQAMSPPPRSIFSSRGRHPILTGISDGNPKKKEIVDDFMAKPLSDEEKRKSIKGYYHRGGSNNNTINLNAAGQNHRRDQNPDVSDDHLINKSKLMHDTDGNCDVKNYNDDGGDGIIVNEHSMVTNKNLSLKFASELLLNVNNTESSSDISESKNVIIVGDSGGGGYGNGIVDGVDDTPSVKIYAEISEVDKIKSEGGDNDVVIVNCKTVDDNTINNLDVFELNSNLTTKNNTQSIKSNTLENVLLTKRKLSDDDVVVGSICDRDDDVGDNSTSSDPDDNNLVAGVQRRSSITKTLTPNDDVDDENVSCKLNENVMEIIDEMKDVKNDDVLDLKNEKQICDELTCIKPLDSSISISKDPSKMMMTSTIADDNDAVVVVELPSFDDDKRANNLLSDDDDDDDSNRNVNNADKMNDSLNTQMNKESNLIDINKKIDSDDSSTQILSDLDKIVKNGEAIDTTIHVVAEEKDKQLPEIRLSEVNTPMLPAPPKPPRGLSSNPFGSDDDDDDDETVTENSRIEYPDELNPFGDDDVDEESGGAKHMAVDESKGAKPKPKPRISTNPFEDDDDDEENENIGDIKLVPRRTPVPTPRKSLAAQSQSPFGSTNSINSLNRHKKGKAPAPPPPVPSMATHPINLSTQSIDSPSVSGQSTPKMKKKRPAPTPPTGTTPIKANDSNISSSSTRRVIKVDDSLKDHSFVMENVLTADTVDYRRKLVAPPSLDDNDSNAAYSFQVRGELSERQLEKLKDNKEAKNRNRKSTEFTALQNELSAKWRHTKGPAPPLPVPISRISMKHELSNQEINHELEVIKVQQNGLEKQGVILEKMIRSRSEEVNGEPVLTNERDVEDLIMQLFEIVNEKNELFRRQAELLNLRRQYRLEQEQADLEYKIRLSMSQPERNKTDTDKEKEDTLIARLVHVVQQRNEVVECFEMDRLREIEEDLSIKQSLEMHTAKRDTKLNQQTLTKLSKKEKKKVFKFASHSKKNKIDADKDEDETEVKTTKSKKHKFIKFSSIIK